MTTHITKTWIEDRKLITETIAQKDYEKREWVGLTDQEIRDTYEWCSGQSEMDRCRAISQI